jgi:hypothetical protein
VDMTKKRALTAIPIGGGGAGLFLDGNYLRQIGDSPPLLPATLAH